MRSLWKTVLWITIGGGVGIPLLFLGAWQVVMATLQGTETMIPAMAWLESFRVMFWPSSMFFVVRAPGDNSGELQYLVVLILINVGVYALVGLAAALALRNRAAQFVLAGILLAAMYGLNAYWSQHLASFLIAAILLVVVLFAFFWRFGASPREATS